MPARRSTGCENIRLKQGFREGAVVVALRMVAHNDSADVVLRTSSAGVARLVRAALGAVRRYLQQSGGVDAGGEAEKSLREFAGGFHGGVVTDAVECHGADVAWRGLGHGGGGKGAGAGADGEDGHR